MEMQNARINAIKPYAKPWATEQPEMPRGGGSVTKLLPERPKGGAEKLLRFWFPLAAKKAVKRGQNWESGQQKRTCGFIRKSLIMKVVVGSGFEPLKA